MTNTCWFPLILAGYELFWMCVGVDGFVWRCVMWYIDLVDAAADEAAALRRCEQAHERELLQLRGLRDRVRVRTQPRSDIDKFEIITKIGKGKYSEVYTGISTQDDKTIVIKALKPVKKSKIKREIKILKALNGHHAIIELKDVVRDPASKSISLVSLPRRRCSTISIMLIFARSSPASPIWRSDTICSSCSRYHILDAGLGLLPQQGHNASRCQAAKHHCQSA